jgi:hypothetical protein
MSVPSDVAAVLSSRDPQVGFLIKLDFVSATKRVWTGFGRLRTLDGNLWDGLGEMVAIDGIANAMSTAATAGKLTVSGVSPDLLPKAIGEESEFLQRPVSIFLQAARGGALIGNPCPLALRLMTSMEVSRQGATRSISINHESPYIGRRNPPNGNYTDRDQQRRFPGDRACERTPTLLYKNERWPDY